MRTNALTKFWLNRKFQIVSTWVWNAIAAFLVIMIVAVAAPGVGLNDEALSDKPALAILPILSEIVAAGLLPVQYTFLRKDRPAIYGLSKTNLARSLLLSIPVVLLYLVFIALGLDRFPSIDWAGIHFSNLLGLPLAILAILAYGPLEVFFVIWLIQKTDELFNSRERLLSPGLILTTVIYGALHAISQGSYALVITAYFLAMGIIYKYSSNSIGPMLAWTIINKFIWFLVVILVR